MPPNPRRDRERRPGRRPAFRDPKPIILIVCEGKNTEPQYFTGFINACQNSRVTIKIADEHGVPKTLVGIAKGLKNGAKAASVREGDDNLAYDSVWCVFDVDDHPQVAEARRMARDNGIDVAVSNPCFELWLLLHFRDGPGQQPRGKLQKMLRKHVSDYDKTINFDKFSAGYTGAVSRARRLDESAEGVSEAGRNPTTSVYKLTESIRGSA